MTIARLISALEELQVDGHPDFELRTNALHPLDECTIRSIVGLVRSIHDSGGSLIWCRYGSTHSSLLSTDSR